TLNNIATAYHAKGDYDTALHYLKRSLAIREDIGDKAGFCATMFNMGSIHWQNDEQQEAMAAWLGVYQMAKPMGLAKVLNALESLAGKIGLAGGLEGWEKLSQQQSENASE
ncbi:MAG: tetratricopeptide (TPR) repeat protein, partial [Alteromonadaceae bacterium]